MQMQTRKAIDMRIRQLFILTLVCFCTSLGLAQSYLDIIPNSQACCDTFRLMGINGEKISDHTNNRNVIVCFGDTISFDHNRNFKPVLFFNLPGFKPHRHFMDFILISNDTVRLAIVYIDSAKGMQIMEEFVLFVLNDQDTISHQYRSLTIFGNESLLRNHDIDTVLNMAKFTYSISNNISSYPRLVHITMLIPFAIYSFEYFDDSLSYLYVSQKYYPKKD